MLTENAPKQLFQKKKKVEILKQLSWYQKCAENVF